MAEALLRARLADRAPEVRVGSAGLVFDGRAAERGAIKAMQRHGLDLEGFRSQLLTAELLEEPSLVLGMERQHAREVAALRPDRFARTYTLIEFVEDADVFGPRHDEPLVAWVERIGRLRTVESYAGVDPSSEVPDPMGRSSRVFRATADQLEGLVDRLVDLAWPVPAVSIAGPPGRAADPSAALPAPPTTSSPPLDGGP